MEPLTVAYACASGALVAASAVDAYSSRGMRELWPLNRWPVLDGHAKFSPVMYAAGTAAVLVVAWLWARSWPGLVVLLVMAGLRAYFGLVKNPRVRAAQARADQALNDFNEQARRSLPMD